MWFDGCAPKPPARGRSPESNIHMMNGAATARSRRVTRRSLFFWCNRLPSSVHRASRASIRASTGPTNRITKKGERPALSSPHSDALFAREVQSKIAQPCPRKSPENAGCSRSIPNRSGRVDGEDLLQALQDRAVMSFLFYERDLIGFESEIQRPMRGPKSGL